MIETGVSFPTLQDGAHDGAARHLNPDPEQPPPTKLPADQAHPINPRQSTSGLGKSQGPPTLLVRLGSRRASRAGLIGAAAGAAAAAGLRVSTTGSVGGPSERTDGTRAASASLRGLPSDFLYEGSDAESTGTTQTEASSLEPGWLAAAITGQAELGDRRWGPPSPARRRRGGVRGAGSPSRTRRGTGDRPTARTEAASYDSEDADEAHAGRPGTSRAATANAGDQLVRGSAAEDPRVRARTLGASASAVSGIRMTPLPDTLEGAEVRQKSPRRLGASAAESGVDGQGEPRGQSPGSRGVTRGREREAEGGGGGGREEERAKSARPTTGRSGSRPQSGEWVDREAVCFRGPRPVMRRHAWYTSRPPSSW